MANKKLSHRNNNSQVNSLKAFCMKYKKNITTGVLIGALALILIISSVTAEKDSKNNNSTPDDATVAADDETTADVETFEVDAYPQINELITNYYGYYANGDVASMEKLAYPISDTEKSYIELYSQFVEAYEDIKCYTKHGVADGEYTVSVSLVTKFKEVDTGAPGLDFFYVRTDENGNVYIDNTYNSQFSQSNQGNDTDADIEARIDEYEQDPDVVALQQEVQTAYEKAIASEDSLENLVSTTIPDAISVWVASVGAQQTTADSENTEEQTSENETSDDDQKDETATDNSDSDDGKTENDNSDDGKTENDSTDDSEKTSELVRTAYAKTKVNMREKKSTNSDVLYTLETGTEITVLGKSENGWFHVKYKKKEGYVKKEYVVFDKAEVKESEQDTSSEQTSEKERTAYTKTKVNMRKTKSTESDVINTLAAGTKITVLGKSQNGWFKVQYKKKKGYIKKEYVVFDQSKVEKEDTSDTNETGQSNTVYLEEGARIELSQSVNIRSAMSESADRIGLAYKGDVVTVIMSYAEGWTKVSWNGETGYAKTEFLK